MVLYFVDCIYIERNTSCNVLNRNTVTLHLNRSLGKNHNDIFIIIEKILM